MHSALKMLYSSVMDDAGEVVRQAVSNFNSMMNKASSC